MTLCVEQVLNTCFLFFFVWHAHDLEMTLCVEQVLNTRYLPLVCFKLGMKTVMLDMTRLQYDSSLNDLHLHSVTGLLKSLNLCSYPVVKLSNLNVRGG